MIVAPGAAARHHFASEPELDSPAAGAAAVTVGGPGPGPGPEPPTTDSALSSHCQYPQTCQAGTVILHIVPLAIRITMIQADCP